MNEDLLKYSTTGSRPIPGQSLTDDPENPNAWEKPPQFTNIDKANRKVNFSIKAKEIAEEKEAVQQYGSSDSGASLGDILGAALNKEDKKD